MGNHSAGYAMDRAARLAVSNRGQRSALSILDDVCSPYRGCDAEFESQNPDEPDEVHPLFDNSTDPHPQSPLGMLLVEAFAPNGLQDLGRYSPFLDDAARGTDAEEAAYDHWESEVYKPFRQRYGFC